MPKPEAWATQAYLDCLRPPSGFMVSAAILATYSAELPAVVAALLALAGRDDDRGSGSKVDLAEAVEHLRGRFSILFQGGRLTAPRRRPAICGLLDQFLVGVPYDASQRSWHPKVALVRMEDAEGNAAWRLWLGSRNLTTSDSLEFGLLLDGSNGSKARGHVIPGVAELARELVARARMPDRSAALLVDEVQDIRWVAPPGVRVSEVRLLLSDGGDNLPLAPRGVEEVTVVSPYLHPRTIRQIGSWGSEGCQRRILSTVSELARVHAAAGSPLAGYAQILALEGAPQAAEDTELNSTAAVEAATERHEPGLHAKLLVARRGNRLTMWVGSANATERAWRGRNAEIVARMEGAAALGSGIEALLGTARPVTHQELAVIGAIPSDEVGDRLEAARAHVVACWRGRLLHEEGVFRLACDGAPHPQDAEIDLMVGRVVGLLHCWPRGTTTFAFGAVPPAEQSGLVTLGLRLADREVTWLQECPVEPPLDEARDRAAIAAYLGPDAFIAWLRSLLGGEPMDPDASGAWDGRPAAEAGGIGTRVASSAPITVEEIMASWARDPAAFEKADQRMREFHEEVVRRSAPENSKSLSRLHEIGETWKLLRSELTGSN